MHSGKLLARTAAALLAFGATATPAVAATMVTTSHSCGGNLCALDDTVLLPFDSSLGTLTGITLHIDVTGQLGFFYLAEPWDAPTNSAHIVYDGPFDAVVNGVAYAVPTFGEKDITNTIWEGFGLWVSGSATFAIVPSLFASFTDQTGICPLGGAGLCASGYVNRERPYTSITADNARVSEDESDIHGTYTLTYTYTPFGAVPEPSAWAMMLLGFAAIGIAVRKRHHENSAVISAVIAAI